MERKLVCTSCKREVSEAGAVSFKCPNCSEFQIIRCGHCREIASRYVCALCSFSGPN